MLVPLLKTNGKYTLIDSENFAYTKANDYEYVDFFEEGFARVRFNKKWHFINIDENENCLSFEANYCGVDQFKDGLAAVRTDDERLSFINKNGIEVSKGGYFEYFRKQKGFIEVSGGIPSSEDSEGNVYRGRLYTGLIDSTGFEVVRPSDECNISVEDDFVLISTKNSYKAVDFNGNKVFNTQDFSYISSFYKNNAISISNDTNEVFIIDSSLRKIKSLGKIGEIELGSYCIINGETTKGFVNGLCVLKSKNKWGFINIRGEFICDCEYDFLNPFLDDCAIAGNKVDGKMKFIILNERFEKLIAYKYDRINAFCEGCAAVELNGKWGVIDNRGNEIIVPKFDKVGDCVNGFISVSCGDYDYKDQYFGKFGFYNKQGEKVCPLIYDWVGDFDTSLTAIVEQRGKYGLINNKGNEVTKIKYDSILNNYSTFYFVEESNRRFVVNDKGQEFIEDKVIDMIIEETLKTFGSTV